MRYRLPYAFVVLVTRELTEARRRAEEIIRESGLVCKGCGVGLNKKTPGCKNCYNRHRGRDLRRSKK